MQCVFGGRKTSDGGVTYNIRIACSVYHNAAEPPASGSLVAANVCAVDEITTVCIQFRHVPLGLTVGAAIVTSFIPCARCCGEVGGMCAARDVCAARVVNDNSSNIFPTVASDVCAVDQSTAIGVQLCHIPITKTPKCGLECAMCCRKVSMRETSDIRIACAVYCKALAIIPTVAAEVGAVDQLVAIGVQFRHKTISATI